MDIGERINTSMGYLIILDIQESYLILFDDLGAKFIKANKYNYKDSKYYWENGEYYNTLSELIAGIN